METDNKNFRYYAFISYNSKDIAWGKRLQHKLEHYRMPATLCSERGWHRKPIDPVFFAPYDIKPGELSEEIKSRLSESKNLIVICSPNSAKSEWVGKEIQYFHELGRDKNIHFFIIDGVPNSDDTSTECFNPIIKSLGLNDILGANINEKVHWWPWLNRERAYVQLVSKLLDVEFDSIWRRHRRLIIRRIILWSLGILAVLAAFVGVWQKNQPVDVAVSLKEASVANKQLPPMQDAVVTLTIENEVKTDTIHSYSDKGLFANIPHNAIGKKARLRVVCSDWNTVDTTLMLSKNVNINMSRDAHVYGNLSFLLWSLATESVVCNQEVEIAGQKSVTDSTGRVSFSIPLEKQNVRYEVQCALELESNIITIPTTESTALIVK